MRTIAAFLFAVGCSVSPPPPQLTTLPPLATRPVRVSTGAAGSYQCTGVVVHKDWALTAAHCFDPKMWVDDVEVTLAYRPSLKWDLLILRAPGLAGGDVTWAKRKPKLHERAILVGFGCAVDHTQVRMVIAKVEAIDGLDLTYDASVCMGDSGGPAFDLQGRLLGLIVRKVKSNDHAVVQYLAE